jgi:hypothetical protein
VDAAVFWKLWKSESGRNQKARFRERLAEVPGDSVFASLLFA